MADPVPDTWPRITPAQSRRLYAISKAAGWTRDGLREFLTDQGYEHSNLIPVAHYDPLIEDLKKGPVAT
jgi:hypothetical protein